VLNEDLHTAKKIIQILNVLSSLSNYIGRKGIWPVKKLGVGLLVVMI